MRIQEWLTLAGVSTLVAGVVVSLSIPNVKPVVIFTATTAGALGGVLLATGERLSLENAKEQAKTQARIQETTLASLKSLEQNLHENSTAIAVLADRIPQRHIAGTNTNHPLFSWPQTNVQGQYSNREQLGTRKTAILYDIENLLKGYNDPKSILKNLSLRGILDRIKQNEQVGPVLIQKAYANWSDSRLRAMHSDINSLGIDPILISGFSYDPKKNAADIELVISAIDLAYLRPAIEVYVIVSGDGGFASLAKKLREFGKTVIGCAYENSTSQVFQSLCDEFIWIPDPDAEKRKNAALSVLPLPRKMSESNLLTLKLGESIGNTPSVESESIDLSISEADQGLLSSVAIDSDIGNLNFIDQLNRIKKQNPTSATEMIELTQVFLNLFIHEPTIAATLANKGITLSIVGKAIKEILPTLQVKSLGFANLTKYMQYVCRGMDYCIATDATKQNTILCLRQKIPSGFQTLPDTDRKLRWKGLDAINSGLIQHLNQIKNDLDSSKTTEVAAIREILSVYAQDATARATLTQSGLELSVAKSAITFIAPDLQTIQYGFIKFVEYLQYVCQGTPLCIAKVPPSNHVLVLRDELPERAILLPDLPPRDVDSIETYQSILANSQPIYRLPSAEVLVRITQWVLEHPRLEGDLRTLGIAIVTDLDGTLSLEVVERTLRSMVAADLFLREPAHLPLAKQQITLLEPLRSQAAILEHLRSHAQKKLERVLPTVNPAILDQMFSPQG